MKKLAVTLLLWAAASGTLLFGGSKPEKAATPVRNSAGSAPAAAASGNPVEMSIHWKVGRTYPLRIELNQSTSNDVPNLLQPATQEMKLTQDYDISVLKTLDNGGRQLELRFVHATMNVSQDGRTVLHFDSTQSPAEDGNDPAAAVLRAVIGARIQYFTDVEGRVAKMEGVDELTRRIAAAAGPKEEAFFKQMFSQDTLRRYVSFADAMPNQMVNIGDSWPLKEDLSSSVGDMALNVKYTFKNWEPYGRRKCAHIVGQGHISSKSTSTTSGATVEIENEDISSDFWFDPTLGMIVGVNDEQDMTMKVTSPTQTLTTQLNQNVRLVLLDKQ